MSRKRQGRRVKDRGDEKKRIKQIGEEKRGENGDRR